LKQVFKVNLTQCLQKIHAQGLTNLALPRYHRLMESSLHHIVERVRAAQAVRLPLRICGAGSKDFLADALTGEPLDMTAHSGIVSYEPSELVVTVKTGTPLAQLEAALAEQGQCLPFEPPRFAAKSGSLAGSLGGSLGGTVGGMVASGLSGPARASVGALRDYVLGVQLVNGKAEHLVFGGQVMKNVAGYDVSRLLTGSWGMLGVITEVSLKVLPLAPAEATLCFEMPQTDALAQLNHWGGEPLPLNASNWVLDNGKPLLFVRLRGAVAAVEAACTKMLAQHSGTRVDTAQAEADWQRSRDMQLPFFTTPPKDLPEAPCLWRLSVPQTTPAIKLIYDQVIDWHGAQRWLWAPASQAPHIRAVAQAAGGSATLFSGTPAHGISRFDLLQAPLSTVHQQLKAEFDPAGIFNPGRMPWFNSSK
jgi:glycolate oxidase FAD binding subunit